jgi:hypothetical protein
MCLGSPLRPNVEMSDREFEYRFDPDDVRVPPSWPGYAAMSGLAVTAFSGFLQPMTSGAIGAVTLAVTLLGMAMVCAGFLLDHYYGGALTGGG